MINKKIASELAVGVILLVALAMGGIFWMENKKDVSIEKKGNAEPKLENNKVDTWKTYENKKYGFSLKYPADLIYGEFEIPKELQNTSYVESAGYDVFNFTLATDDPNNAKAGIGVTVQKRKNSMPILEEVDAAEEIVKIGGVDAFKHSGSYYFEKNGYIYSVYSFGDGDAYFYNMLNSVISTFEFTEIKDGNIACTQEAKLCEDGSYVGRTGPNCEFAPCPL